MNLIAEGAPPGSRDSSGANDVTEPDDANGAADPDGTDSANGAADPDRADSSKSGTPRDARPGPGDSPETDRADSSKSRTPRDARPRADDSPETDGLPVPVDNETGPAPRDDRIAALCAVTMSMARKVRGHSMFVGWTSDGRPAAATTLKDLTEEARRTLTDFQASGLKPRQIAYEAVVPVTFLIVGPAVDFSDAGRHRAEDQIRYTVIDAHGERREIAIGERTVLGAIADARTPWQASENRLGAEPAVSAVPLYTLFAPLPGARVDTGIGLLFQSTLPGSTNEPVLRSFIRHTIGRLLVLDESQPASARKGYLEAAGRLAGTPPKGGTLGTLVLLKRMGMVDFDDGWLKGLELTKRRARGHFIRLLRGIGMVEISDEMLDELTHPRPDYDIDRLDLDRMFDLAEAMYEVANRILAR